jgi:hypothetical protein
MTAIGRRLGVRPNGRCVDVRIFLKDLTADVAADFLVKPIEPIDLTDVPAGAARTTSDSRESAVAEHLLALFWGQGHRFLCLSRDSHVRVLTYAQFCAKSSMEV